MSSLLTILGFAATSFVSIWAVLKYLVLGQYRLDNDTSKRLISKVVKSKCKQWILTKELVLPPKHPTQYEAFVIFNGLWFFVSRSERLMTAGWQSKEEVSSISFLRWQREKIDRLLRGEDDSDNTIPVMALLPSSTDRLGELTCDPNPSIYLDPALYQDIEDDVIKVLAGEKNKTGALLYGKPGNGKTQFTKYLARKYRLPIYVIYLNPEYNNLDLAMMFASIPPRCIVLMEDFDNYFNKRTCIIKNENVRFTFDAIINALDGIHNDYQQVIFMMTANDITKIDSSIKDRRSRFQFIKRFGPPSDKVRMKILNEPQLVKETKGLSLDQVFARRTT
jgi:hypothetical protein